MSQQVSVKKHSTGFTQIPNELICSNQLTAKAKAVYCYVFSRPDDWKFYLADMVNQMFEGLDAVRAALKELETAGWLIRRQVKDEKGKFTWCEIEIFSASVGVASLPHREKPYAGEPYAENPRDNNTDLTNTDLNKKINNKKRSPSATLAEWEASNGRLVFAMVESWAKENYLDKAAVEEAIEAFREKCPQKGYKYADFAAAFKNWQRKNSFQGLRAANAPKFTGTAKEVNAGMKKLAEVKFYDNNNI